jgi:hypothetical protein
LETHEAADCRLESPGRMNSLEMDKIGEGGKAGGNNW